MLSSFFAVPSVEIARKPVLTALALCFAVSLAGCTGNMGASGQKSDMTCGTTAPVGHVEGMPLDTDPKAERLFEQPVDRINRRFNRIEDEVQRLRDDFDQVTPAIGRLIEMEHDLQDLIEDLDDAEGARPAPYAADAPPLRLDRMYNNTPEPQSEAAAPATGEATVSAVRFGEHLDKTRIVFDLSDETGFSVMMQEDRMAMSVTLPNAAWQADRNWESDLAPLVRSYRAEPLSDGGYQVIFTFHEPARVIRQEILPPRAHRGYGLVIDLFSPVLHEG